MDLDFSEPRGWALSWEGTGLFPAADCVAPDGEDRQAPDPGLALPWRQIAVPGLPLYRNGNGRNGLAAPRGWALNWDGAALVGVLDTEAPASFPAVEHEKEG
jgi:hypothetical protein